VDQVSPYTTACAGRTRPWTPDESPLEMPIQDLHRCSSPLSPRIPVPLSVALARALMLFMTAGIMIYGVSTYWGIRRGLPWDPLSILSLILYSILLGWIAFSAASGMAALLVPPLKDAGIGAEGPAKTALIMPLYNEDPFRVTMGLQAMAEALALRGAATGFEVFVLSDTSRPEALDSERRAIQRLREALSGVMSVWYRHREENRGRKAGNVEDFVKRWGGRYEFMIVLDADSLMSASTLVELVRRMQRDPTLGILQTVPTPYGHYNLYSRFQQFSSALYGRCFADGIAAWAGNEGNYWGHNAIIRVRAFAASCRLPFLKGRPPFGGHILSHDFVEAALARRSGWKVRIATDLAGSWEESPPSLIDVAIRDRRWMQGNLQHLKVMGTRGLTMTNRLHFLVGIMGYLASPLWFVFISLGLCSVVGTMWAPGGERAVIDPARMLSLFLFTNLILLLPKVLSFVRACSTSRGRASFGGLGRLVLSATLELVLSVLYAPVMMLLHTRQAGEILLGHDSGWAAQRRCADRCAWSEAFRAHWSQSLVGLVMGSMAFAVSPSLLLWMSPVIFGLVLSIPLSKLSGSIQIGRALERFGIFRIPEERHPAAVIRRRDELYGQYLEWVTAATEEADSSRQSWRGPLRWRPRPSKPTSPSRSGAMVPGR